MIMLTTYFIDTESQAADYQQEFHDRRKTARIQTPVPIRIRRPGAGHGSDVMTVVDNLSAGGFYVRLRLKVARGETLSALIKFSSPDSDESRGAPRLAVRGRVLRVDKLPGDAYGAAVRVLSHRFV